MMVMVLRQYFQLSNCVGPAVQLKAGNIISVQLRLAQFFLGESVQVCARLYARTCLYPIT